MTEIIQLTDTSRLRIEHDDDAHADNPRQWSPQTGFVKIPDRGDSRILDVLPAHTPPIPIADAHSRYEEQAWHWEPGGMDSRAENWVHRKTFDPEERVVRWALVFHDRVLEYDAEHGGYWFVHMDEDFSADRTGQAEIIADEQETYRAWAEGEVYGVILERKAQWARITKGGVIVGGDQIETWEEAESLWGCYLDTDYTAEDVAREHWDLTDEEEAALDLLRPRKENTDA